MKKRIENIKEILSNKNANEVESFDMSGGCYFVDSVILATSLGSRHSSALLKELKDKTTNEEFIRVEDSDEWIVIDLGDILVHIMDEKTRETYNLEKFLSTYDDLFGDSIL